VANTLPDIKSIRSENDIPDELKMKVFNAYYVYTDGGSGLQPGSFTNRLYQAIALADRTNKQKPESVFLKEVWAYKVFYGLGKLGWWFIRLQCDF